MINQEIIDEMTRRLVATYDPVVIYLFGSHARGYASDDSDVDLAVVVDEINEPRHKFVTKGLRALFDIGVGKDLVLYAQEDFDTLKKENTTFAYQIVKNGKIIYAKANA